MRIRVATANLHGLRAGVAGAAEILASDAVDLAMVQESGPRERFRALAERAGMERVDDPPAVLQRRVQNGLLVRRPWRVASVEHRRFAGSARWHPRGATIAAVANDDLTVWAIVTHLGFVGAERGAHAREVVGLLAGRDPFVIGADLNVGDDSATVRTFCQAGLDAGRTAGATFPATDPSARIDYVFVSPGIRVLHSAVQGGPEVSDHLMVAAELEIGGSEPKAPPGAG
jgi:endonuclease/exonuclease/phosphatase family metal-dependent hydrolase